MSILNVEHLTHGFGDRAIFNDVSFRLLKGEHIGLIGANGEGKSTFMNIITGKLMPDEGKVEWAKNVRVGYLDQHTVLTPGMTIRQVLASAFDFLYDMEAQMNEICDKMGDATSEELEQYMEDLGTIQDLLTMHDFYMIDAKVEEVARALGLMDIGLDRDVTELSGGQRTKVLLGKLLLEKPDILLLDEPTNHLDLDAIAWLEDFLIDFENTVIVVSHDRYFLNKVCTQIADIDYGKIQLYAGNYDFWYESSQLLIKQMKEANKKRKKRSRNCRSLSPVSPQMLPSPSRLLPENVHWKKLSWMILSLPAENILILTSVPSVRSVTRYWLWSICPRPSTVKRCWMTFPSLWAVKTRWLS